MEFCIYQENHNCKLDEIYVDDLGMCANCVCIDIDFDPTVKIKQKHASEHFK